MTSMTSRSASLAGGGRDGPAGRAVPGRVVEQVGHHLVQPAAVGHARAAAGSVATNVTSRPARGRVRPRPPGRATWRNSSTSNSARSSGTTPASIRDRSSSSVTSRPSRSVWASAVRSVVRVGDPVDDVLQHRLEREDRGTQLVRHVRDQFAPVPVGRGEVGGHLVERGGELADLVPRRRPYPRV